jgi:hypothetical protein
VDLLRLIESPDTGQIHNRPQWEAGVATTFQLLEDYAQGYEQRIPASGNQSSPGDLVLIDRPLFQPPAQAGQLLGPQAGTLIARLTVMRIFPPTPPNTEPVLLYAGNAEHILTASGVISGQGSFRSDDASAVFSIIGGTGTYELAQGTITLDYLPSNRGRLTYDVLP